jgi:diacylglycerol kinase (ATP)
MSDPDTNAKNQPLYRRLRFAVAGLCEAWRRERSFRTQTAVALAVVLVLIALRPPLVWWALVGFVIAVVLAFEALNGALETLVDHLHPDIHPEIRIVKDMAAGAVLLVVIGAVMLSGLLLLAVARGAA